MAPDHSERLVARAPARATAADVPARLAGHEPAAAADGPRATHEAAAAADVPRAVDLAAHAMAGPPDVTLGAHLAGHEPTGLAEAAALRRIRRLVTWLDAPLDEHADPTHVTGSAIVLDEAGRVLLHRHKRLGVWLQPGGHVDPGEQPWDGALRETREETGAMAEHPGGEPVLVHVDVHEGPRGHVHLDLRYLLLAQGDAQLRPAAGESPHVAWFAAEEAAELGDVSLADAIAAACRWHERHAPQRSVLAARTDDDREDPSRVS